MSKLKASFAIAAIFAGAACTQAAALSLDFKGVAVIPSQGNVFSYINGPEPSTSFAGQPVNFAMDVSTYNGAYYVDNFILTWSNQNYSLPYLTGWVGTGYPDDPLFDSDIGSESDVTIGTTGGSVRMFSTFAYIAYYDGGLLFDMNYTLSSPHGPGDTFTDNSATGGGTLSVSVNDNGDPFIGPYDADSEVTFDITSVSQIGTPEPATWAMMLLGFAAVGGAIRARRRSADVRAAV